MLTARCSTKILWIGTIWILAMASAVAQEVSGPTETVPLTIEGDLASQMVDGIDRFLLQQIETAAASRGERFTVDTSSVKAYEASLKPHREKLAKCLGVRDARMPFTSPEVIAGVGTDSVIASSEHFTVQAIRWPVLSDPAPQGEGLPSIFGEGLLLTPKGDAIANVIVLPDADQTPEQLCGLADGVPEASQVARHLAEAGCRVVVPTLISRHREKRQGRADLTNREYLHRVAFELGRTLAGYEVQMSLSIVDWFKSATPDLPVGVLGYGEGGMLALFAAGLDTRIQTTCVSGFFGPREGSWNEPIDRNFSGLLRDFGATELAMLVAPRTLIVEASKGPELVLPGNGGGPAELKSPDATTAKGLLTAATDLLKPLTDSKLFIQPSDGEFGASNTRSHFLSRFGNKPLAQALFPLLREEAVLSAELGTDHPKLKALRLQIELTRKHLEQLAAGRLSGNKPADSESDQERAFAQALFPLLKEEAVLSAELGTDHPKLKALRLQIELTRKHLEQLAAGRLSS